MPGPPPPIDAPCVRVVLDPAVLAPPTSLPPPPTTSRKKRKARDTSKKWCPLVSRASPCCVVLAGSSLAWLRS
eukprot:8799440-Alexandrium_andersonii.AAC.1